MESANVRPHSRHLVRLVVIVAATLGLLSATAPTSSALDVYTTPGQHSLNGRTWLTECKPYSSVVERCTTYIWGTSVTYKNGQFIAGNAWAFNNLTYKTSNRADWEPFNALVTPGDHTISGRKWKTQCDTAWTGSNGCRSQILSMVPEYKNGKYQMVNKWVFNNIVHVTPIKCPVPQSQIRTMTGQPSIVTSACRVSTTNSNWLTADYVLTNPAGTLYTETAFFFKHPSGWGLELQVSQNITSVCADLWRASGAPLDTAEAINYCFKG